MPDARWGALLPGEGGRGTLYAVGDGNIETLDLARADDAETMAGIPAARIVTLDAASRVSPPTSTLPGGLRSLGALQQAGPAALL